MRVALRPSSSTGFADAFNSGSTSFVCAGSEPVVPPGCSVPGRRAVLVRCGAPEGDCVGGSKYFVEPWVSAEVHQAVRRVHEISDLTNRQLPSGGVRGLQQGSRRSCLDQVWVRGDEAVSQPRGNADSYPCASSRLFCNVESPRLQIGDERKLAQDLPPARGHGRLNQLFDSRRLVYARRASTGSDGPRGEPNELRRAASVSPKLARWRPRPRCSRWLSFRSTDNCWVGRDVVRKASTSCIVDHGVDGISGGDSLRSCRTDLADPAIGADEREPSVRSQQIRAPCSIRPTYNCMLRGSWTDAAVCVAIVRRETFSSLMYGGSPTT